MQEGAHRLAQVLKDLVRDGSISADQSELINDRFEVLGESDSRRSVFAEIAGYLGGAFVFIAVVVLASQRWNNASAIAKFSVLAAVSIILAVIGVWLNGRTPMLLRLTSVLMMASAISMTAAIALGYQYDGAPWLPFLIGCFIAVASLIKYRSEILQIGSYGFLFITGFMVIGKFYGVEPDQSPLYPLWWVAIASIWIYFSHNRNVDTTLGYLMGVATIFIATQFLFGTSFAIYSYLVSITASILLTLIFFIDHRWPLLVGAVALITFTAGEFVASTLGGSLGALVGLLTAGIALISGSLFAIKKLR